MCTAISYKTNARYFGRTFDYECSYGESVVITPRAFPLHFRYLPTLDRHYAMIGVATVVDGCPLYYDGVNEHGLCMAGLNFPDNAHYFRPQEGRDNVATFEFIPWILGRCATVDEAATLLGRINLTDDAFNESFPTATLHWIISDGERSLTVESMRNGLNVYENTIGVLTNNPPFETQMFLLNQYMRLSRENPKNTFAPGIELDAYSRGMGGIGLPGDLSSTSRFARVAFTKLNSVICADEDTSVSQFFHIMDTVAQTRGCCELDPDVYEITIYTSCCNADRGLYYYKTYDNFRINCIDMHAEDLDSASLVTYPLLNEPDIKYQNR